MSDRLERLLQSRPYLLADGATGTNLFDMGLMTGDAPEMWNFEQPERIATPGQGEVRLVRVGARAHACDPLVHDRRSVRHRAYDGNAFG